MESEVILSLSIFAAAILAVLTTAINLGVQATVILEKPKLRAGLRTKIFITGGICSALGFLFLIMMVLTIHGQFSYAFWPPWSFWGSIGIVFSVSVGIPVLIQGFKLGKTGDNLREFARELLTLVRWLRNIAISGLVIVVVIIPLVFWLIGLFKQAP